MAEPTEGRDGIWWPGVGAGVAVALAIALVPSGLHHVEGMGFRPAYAAAGAALMAVWWLTEALPMGVTACVPLVLFPLLGVHGKGLLGDERVVAGAYIDAYLFLFLGGMVLGAGMEEQGLHRRIALHVLRAVGTDPRRLLLGVLVATAGISAWISNTATAVMMLPIALALVRKLEESAGTRLSHFGGALALAVAYGANLGGIATKIGTGTNSIFCGFLAERLHLDVGFLAYMAIATPFTVLFVPVIWFALWRVGRRDAKRLGPVPIADELAALGPMTAGERRVAVLFGTAAALWIAGDWLRPMIAPFVPVFWEGFKFAGKHWEAGVATVCGLALFAVRGVTLRAIRGLPWSTLLLLGGSFAMAGAIDGSGLSTWLANQLGAIAAWPLTAQVAVAAVASISLSAVASNTATVSVMLAVLPRSLPVLYACAFGASCDFALPAGTPPNAIVFGSGYIRLPTMVKVGVALDLAAAVAITLFASTWVAWLN